jgi:RHS repeat-associated protein
MYGAYRYGFNGKENDNEVKGAGNQQDYGMRIYDPRLGRFLSVDPFTHSYPWYTPYQFSGNNPIKFIDADGGEPKDPGIPTSLSFGVIFIENNVFVTRDFVLNSAKAHGISEPRKSLPRIGRIFEDAALRSLNLNERKVPITPYPERPDRYFIPDNIRDYEVDAGKTKYIFKQAFITDVKYSTGKELVLEPYWNPEQIKGFIDHLATVRGVTINGVETNDRVADYGAAALILVTPSDLPISSQVIQYAKERNVAVLRSVVIGITPMSGGGEAGAITNNRIKVAPAYVVSPSENKMKNSDLYRAQSQGAESGDNYVGDKVNINWENK